MYSELLSHIITTQDAALLKQEIGLLQDSTYKTKADAFAETLKTQVRQWVADAIEAELHTEKIAPDKYLSGLLDELKKNASIQMNIAFEPTRQNIEKIHDWLFRQLGIPVVLDLVYDPQVIAGAKLAYNGKYYDFSLGKQLEPSIESIAKKTLTAYA
jgi:F0F1-type ATP synthase delta subunit